MRNVLKIAILMLSAIGCFERAGSFWLYGHGLLAWACLVLALVCIGLACSLEARIYDDEPESDAS